MKNILFLVQSNQFSGAEIVLKDYFSEVNKKYAIHLFTNKKLAEFYSEVLTTDNIYTSKSMKRIYFNRNPIHLMSYTLNTIINLISIHRIVKKQNIQILYGNNSIDCILLAFYRKFFNKKVKNIAHLHDMFDGKSSISKFIKRYSELFDQILVPSDATNRSVKKLTGRSDVKTIYNGITIIDDNSNFDESEFKNFFNLPNDKFIISFIGAIENRKRPDIFVEVIQKLNAIRNDFYAIIVGKTIDPFLKNSLLEFSEKYDLPLKFIGMVDYSKMPSIYRITDVLILTSDNDPLPTVILESMAHRKLVISRNVDGASEMIEHNKNGFLFSYDEHAEKITNQVNEILDLDGNRKAKIQNNALNTIKEKFSNKLKKERIESILNSL